MRFADTPDAAWPWLRKDPSGQGGTFGHEPVANARARIGQYEGVVSPYTDRFMRWHHGEQLLSGVVPEGLGLGRWHNQR